MSNLPDIKIDGVLANFPELTEGSQVPTPQVIKGLWAYIKANNLKVQK